MKIISKPLKSFVWLISLTLGWNFIHESVYSASKVPGVDGYQVEDAELKVLNEKLGLLIDQLGYTIPSEWSDQEKLEAIEKLKIKQSQIESLMQENPMKKERSLF